MVTEKDRGGIIVHHMAYFNNRFFQSQQNVSVPWSNKELTVSLKTWRDKMEPGDDETWTLTVEGKKQEKVVEPEPVVVHATGELKRAAPAR